MRQGFTASFELLILYFTAPCPDPTLANGTILSLPPPYKGKHLLNFIVFYDCDPGYNRTGSHASLCTANQIWRPAPPKCIGNNFTVFGL